MYKTVVFDLDGTLLDTLDDLWLSVNAALQKFGLPVRTRNEVRDFIGNGIVKLMQRASGLLEGECFDGVLAEFKRHYGEHCEDNTKPYEGIMRLLQELRARGVQTAVVSNKADFAVQDLCKIWFDGLFDVAVGEREGLLRKPAPDSVFEVCRLLGVSVEESVYIGDSEVDYQTACNAKMDVISVEWGFRDAAFLKEIGAKKIVSTPGELAECFGISL